MLVRVSGSILSYFVNTIRFWPCANTESLLNPFFCRAVVSKSYDKYRFLKRRNEASLNVASLN